MNWHGVAESVESSCKLLEELWNMDADAVAEGIEKAHEEISILQYNDENSLSCTIQLAFYFASGILYHNSGITWRERDSPTYV